MLILVVNERLEEGKNLDAVKAKARKIGGAIKDNAVTAGLTAAMVASTAVGVNNWDKHPIPDADKPAATADADTNPAERPLTRGQIRGNELRDKADRFIPAGETNGHMPAVAPQFGSNPKGSSNTRRNFDPSKRGPTGQGINPRNR